MRVARHAVVTGRVQGVFFRQSAAEKAHHLGISGWVRNRGDGSVEAHIEGEADAIQSMIDWLHRGPSHAEVEVVRISEAEPENSTQFDIRH